MEDSKKEERMEFITLASTTSPSEDRERFQVSLRSKQKQKKFNNKRMLLISQDESNSGSGPQSERYAYSNQSFKDSNFISELRSFSPDLAGDLLSYEEKIKIIDQNLQNENLEINDYSLLLATLRILLEEQRDNCFEFGKQGMMETIEKFYSVESELVQFHLSWLFIALSLPDDLEFIDYIYSKKTMSYLSHLMEFSQAKTRRNIIRIYSNLAMSSSEWKTKMAETNTIAIIKNLLSEKGQYYVSDMAEYAFFCFSIAGKVESSVMAETIFGFAEIFFFTHDDQIKIDSIETCSILLEKKEFLPLFFETCLVGSKLLSFLNDGNDRIIEAAIRLIGNATVSDNSDHVDEFMNYDLLDCIENSHERHKNNEKRTKDLMWLQCNLALTSSGIAKLVANTRLFEVATDIIGGNTEFNSVGATVESVMQVQTVLGQLVSEVQSDIVISFELGKKMAYLFKNWAKEP